MSETSLILAMTPTPATAQCGETLSLQFTATNTTDDLIDVHSLSFKFEPGTYPTSLAHDFKNVTFRARQGGWLMHQEGAVFIVTPANKESGQVGPKGLEFDISGIIVNDEPGTTAVTMGKTIGADKTHSEIVVYLSKVYPSLAIHSFHAVNSNILYDTAPELVWEASLGAAITLSSPNGTITHVKGHPELPLPSSGSYQIDTPLIQNTNFTLTANANAMVAAQAEVQSQTMVSIMPPAVQLTSTIPPNAKPLEVELEWQIAGATSATLTSTVNTTGEDIAPQNGTKIQNILSKTTFTLTAQNPVNRTPTSVTTTIAPTPFGWQSIAPDQAAAGKKSRLFSTHMGLALMTDTGGSGTLMQTSCDGLDWVTSDADIPFDQMSLPCVAHTDAITYLSFTHNGSKPLQPIYSSTDLHVWTPIEGPPPDPYYYRGPSICVDDVGNLYSYLAGPVTHLCKLPVGTSDWQDLGVVDNLTTSNIKWFAGKLWLIDSCYNDTGPLQVQSSADGKTWTKSEGPTIPTGLISVNFGVTQDRLCLFYLETVNQTGNNPQPQPVPFALWRMDAAGKWNQDVAVPNMMLLPSPEAPDVACFNGVTYTAGNSYISPTGGIWACNMSK